MHDDVLYFQQKKESSYQHLEQISTIQEKETIMCTGFFGAKLCTFGDVFADPGNMYDDLVNFFCEETSKSLRLTFSILELPSASFTRP